MNIKALTRLAPVALAVFFGLSCGFAPEPPEAQAPTGPPTPEEAKQALYDRGIHYSQITFVQTITRNDLDAIRLFFAAGMDPNVRGEFGSTPLMAAVSPHRAEMARYLLNEGADPNILMESGAGPLLFAAQSDSREVMRLLLDAGADPNAADEKGRTPLIDAAVRGYEETVRLLLAHGAQADHRDMRGRTALSFAKDKGYRAIIEQLEDALSQE